MPPVSSVVIIASVELQTLVLRKLVYTVGHNDNGARK